jgi:hypothetical protein
MLANHTGIAGVSRARATIAVSMFTRLTIDVADLSIAIRKNVERV